MSNNGENQVLVNLRSWNIQREYILRKCFLQKKYNIEPQAIDVSELKEESALRSILLEAAKDSHTHAIKNLKRNKFTAETKLAWASFKTTRL